MAYIQAPEWLLALDTQGFAHIPKEIPESILKAVEAALFPLKSESEFVPANWYFQEHDGRKYPNRLNHLLQYIPEGIAQLLNAPALRTLGNLACGNPWFSVLESVIIKHPEAPYSIPPHRDMIHDGKYRLLTVGIYLDDVMEGGEIYFIPGSHLDREPAGDRATCTVRAKRGDMVVHDVRTLHGTTQNRGTQSIHTIYFELRPTSYFETAGKWTPCEVAQRVGVMECIAQGKISEIGPLLEGRFLLEGADY